MPTYAYACTTCDHRFEAQQSFSDAALTECPQCQGRLRKLFNSVGIVGSLVLGLTADRAGVRLTMLGAYLALGLALWSLGAAAQLSAIVALSGAVGFLVMGTQYILYSLAPTLYPQAARAAGAGAVVGVGRFGAILGPLLAGDLRQAGWSAGQVLTTLTPVALAAGAAIVAMTYLAKVSQAEGG